MRYVLGLIVILAAIASIMIRVYNKAVVLRNYVKEAFSTMDVYMKKRWDLIPNLMETVKGYMEHEKEVFEKVTALRNTNYSACSDEEKIDINNKLSLGLSKIVATAENYPELKANQSFQDLMGQLKIVEDDIANARKYYNGTVRELNTYTEMFPSNIICAMFNIKSATLFEIDETERQNVKVEF